MRTCHLNFWFLFCSTHSKVLCFCLFVLWSHCACSTFGLLLCRLHTHTVPCLQTQALSSSQAKPLRLCQPLNTLSWSFWHIMVSTTLLPAGRAPLQGRRIPLLRVYVSLGDLESVWKAPWTIQIQSLSAALFWERWSGNEFIGLKLAALVFPFSFLFFFGPREEENPRIQIGQRSRSWWGLTICYQHDILPIWQNVHLCRHISYLLSGSSEIPSPGSHI